MRPFDEVTGVTINLSDKPSWRRGRFKDFWSRLAAGDREYFRQRRGHTDAKYNPRGEI